MQNKPKISTIEERVAAIEAAMLSMNQAIGRLFTACQGLLGGMEELARREAERSGKPKIKFPDSIN